MSGPLDYTPEAEEQKRRCEMSKKLHEGGVYRHYKNGRTYVIEHLAENSNGGEVIVVYREYGDVGRINTQRYWRQYHEFGEKFSWRQ